MITIYTRTNCSHCQNAKAQMNALGVPYQEQIIGQTIQREEVMSKFPGVSALPIVVSDGMVSSGWDGFLGMIEAYRGNAGKAMLTEGTGI